MFEQTLPYPDLTLPQTLASWLSRFLAEGPPGTTSDESLTSWLERSRGLSERLTESITELLAARGKSEGRSRSRLS